MAPADKLSRRFFSGAAHSRQPFTVADASEIDVPKQGSENFRLKLSVEKKFEGMVRADSVATIATEGMVGNKFVNLSAGSGGAAECSNGCTLRSEEPVEVSELMKQGKQLLNTTQGTISDLQHHADAAIGNITKASGHADQMLVAMRGNVERMASNGAQITDDVRNGRGTVGKLLTDDCLAAMTLSAQRAKQRPKPSINSLRCELRFDLPPALT